MLESALKEQLKGIFANLEGNFTFDIYVSPVSYTHLTLPTN